MSLALALTCLLSVHDGDSLRCGAERIRLASIDAPELPGSVKCAREGRGWCDYPLAVRSREALRGFLANGSPRIRRCGTDRYGRTLALVYVDGVEAGEWLIDRGLARRWTGRTGCED